MTLENSPLFKGQMTPDIANANWERAYAGYWFGCEKRIKPEWQHRKSWRKKVKRAVSWRIKKKLQKA